MKNYLLFLLLCLPVLVICQSRSSLDFVGGVDYTYRNLLLGSGEGAIDFLRNFRADDNTKFNWRLGINYNKQIGEKLYIKTGLHFANVGFKGIKITDLVFNSDFYFSNISPINGSLPREVQIIHTYSFLEIPVMFRYELGNKQLNPFVEAGISPYFFLIQRTKTITDLGTTSELTRKVDDNFNHLHFVGNIAFGLQYQLKPQLSLYGMPFFRYHFTPTVNAPILEFLYSGGLEFGLRRDL